MCLTCACFTQAPRQRVEGPRLQTGGGGGSRGGGNGDGISGRGGNGGGGGSFVQEINGGTAHPLLAPTPISM
jgi:hypothetical protein